MYTTTGNESNDQLFDLLVKVTSCNSWVTPGVTVFTVEYTVI